VPENVALIIRFHLMSGEDVSVMSGDFDGEPEAVAAIARAMDERRSLVLMRARYGRETDVNGVVINLANVVSVRVSKTASAEAGQYL
jgi:ribosomal protein L24